jgi:hypothetical protein
MSKVQLQGNVSGTGVFTIASPNSNTDRTLTLPDNTGTVVTTGSTGGVSQAMLASNIAGNGPAFSARPSSNQTINFNTQTKVLLQTEDYDTNNNFASSTFTPTVAGYYSVVGQVRIDFVGGRQISTTVSLFKNGTVYLARENSFVAGNGGSFTSVIEATVPMNGSSDTLEFYIYQYDYTTASAYSTVSVQVAFQGFLARTL